MPDTTKGCENTKVYWKRDRYRIIFWAMSDKGHILAKSTKIYDILRNTYVKSSMTKLLALWLCDPQMPESNKVWTVIDFSAKIAFMDTRFSSANLCM